jgi:hypothetical protein
MNLDISQGIACSYILTELQNRLDRSQIITSHVEIVEACHYLPINTVQLTLTSPIIDGCIIQ